MGTEEAVRRTIAVFSGFQRFLAREATFSCVLKATFPCGSDPLMF